jgi:hypothetical protein
MFSYCSSAHNWPELEGRVNQLIDFVLDFFIDFALSFVGGGDESMR